jgi:hypothetical protein
LGVIGAVVVPFYEAAVWIVSADEAVTGFIFASGGAVWFATISFAGTKALPAAKFPAKIPRFFGAKIIPAYFTTI